LLPLQELPLSNKMFAIIFYTFVTRNDGIRGFF